MNFKKCWMNGLTTKWFAIGMGLSLGFIPVETLGQLPELPVQRQGAILYRVSEANQWIQIEAPYQIKMIILDDQAEYLALNGEMVQTMDREDISQLREKFPGYELRAYSQNAWIEKCELPLPSGKRIPCELPPGQGTYFSMMVSVKKLPDRRDQNFLIELAKSNRIPEMEFEVLSSIPVVVRSARATVETNSFYEILNRRGIRNRDALSMQTLLGFGLSAVQQGAANTTTETQMALLVKLLDSVSTLSQTPTVNTAPKDWAQLLDGRAQLIENRGQSVTLLEEVVQLQKRTYKPVLERALK